MSNQKPGLRFRIPSWFAPAPASSSRPPPQESSNQPASTSPSTHSNKANNFSSAAAKQAPPSDEALNRNKSRTGAMPQNSTAAEKTPFKPPGKVAQNSNSQSQTSKTKPDSPPQARTTSQPHPDKLASPTKLNNQPSSPPRVGSQPKAKPVQLSPTASPQLLSTSKESTQSRAKPERNSDHEVKSTEEADFKSSPPIINFPKALTELPQSEATNGSEIKPTNEVVSKPSSPTRSPQSPTNDNSLLPSTTTEPTSAIDKETVAANSRDQAKVTHNEIKGRPEEQMLTSPKDSESPLPTPRSNSSNMNYQREKIPESGLKTEVEEQVTAKVQDKTDKELEKEKKVINELQGEESGSENHIKEQQSVAVQPEHTNGETKKNVDESTPSSKQKKSANKPSHQDSNDECHPQHAAFIGEEFPINNVPKNYKHQLRQIETRGGQGASREERPTSVITLAGDNRGATMEIDTGLSRREQGLHIHSGYNHNQDKTNESTKEREGIQNEIDSDKQKPVDDYAADMYINSNLQCINNTIMFNSSITQRDPGVHVVPSHTSVESNKNADTKKSVTYKAEINITNAKELTYEPNGSSSSTAKRAFAGTKWF